jgi:hypothetical protein
VKFQQAARSELQTRVENSDLVSEQEALSARPDFDGACRPCAQLMPPRHPPRARSEPWTGPFQAFSCGNASITNAGSKVPADRLLNGRCPRQELNLCTRFRKPLLYPLSYGGNKPHLQVFLQMGHREVYRGCWLSSTFYSRLTENEDAPRFRTWRATGGYSRATPDLFACGRVRSQLRPSQSACLRETVWLRQSGVPGIRLRLKACRPRADLGRPPESRR